jgi:hypothetical protein
MHPVQRIRGRFQSFQFSNCSRFTNATSNPFQGVELLFTFLTTSIPLTSISAHEWYSFYSRKIRCDTPDHDDGMPCRPSETVQGSAGKTICMLTM